MSKLVKFNPTIRTEKAIDIKTNYKSKLDQLADSEGRIETKLNKESLIQAISHKLYRNAESGFRELLNNEIRACQIAREKFKTDPYIKVSLNTLTRNLTIQGFNSLGITEEVFDKILREIGTSTVESKKDGRIPFGMGFYGFLKLSDIACIQTKCVENGDTYGFMAKGGLFFQKIQRPDFKETGTKIWLTLKEKTNYEKIINVLTEISKVSGIKTYFELNAHKGKVSNFSSGIHELKSTTYEKIFNDTLDKNKYSYLTAHVNNDEIEAFISVGIDEDGEINNLRNKKLFLINSPIEAVIDEEDYDDYDYEKGSRKLNDDDDDDEEDDDEKSDTDYKAIQASKIDQIEFSSLVINMKKESIFIPHQDRERLTPEAEKKLRGIIIELYKQAVKSMKPCSTLKDWFKHEHKYFISYEEQNFSDLFDNETLKLHNILNEEYWSVVGKSRCDDLKELINSYETLATHLHGGNYKDNNKNYNSNTKLFYIEKKDSRIKRILDEHIPNHFLVYLNYDGFYDDSKWKEKLSDRPPTKKQIENIFEKIKKKPLLDYGFIEAKQYIKDNNLKTKTEPKLKKELDNSKLWIKLHNKTFEHCVKDIPFTMNIAHKDKIFRVTNYAKFQPILADFEEIFFTVDTPTIRDSEIKIMTPEEHEEVMKDDIYITNHGDLTVKQILKFGTKTKIALSTDDSMKRGGIFGDTLNKNNSFTSKLIERVPKDQLYIIGKPEYLRKQSVLVNDYDENYTAIGKLRVLLENRNFKNVQLNQDSLDNHHRKSLEKLEKQTLFNLFGKRRKTYNDNNWHILAYSSFDNTKEYEEYLKTLEKIDKEIKIKQLRKIFCDSHNSENYKERTEQIFELQKLVRKK